MRACSRGGFLIDDSDARLVEWAREIVPDASVTLAPPPAADAKGVFITLLAITPVAAPRASRRPPREIALDYLVSTAAEDVRQAHAWLGALAFAALDVATWTVSVDALPLQLWQAFAVAPRPAFMIRVPERLERPYEAAPLVRTPPSVDSVAVVHLEGEVYGPGNIPVAGARVEVPALQLFARTDADGTFHIPAVPADTTVAVVVRAKGQTLQMRTRPGERLHVELNANSLEG